MHVKNRAMLKSVSRTITPEEEVLGDDGEIYFLPLKGMDDEGYHKVLLGVSTIDSVVLPTIQSIKPFIGRRVVFWLTVIGQGCDYVVVDED